MFTGIPARIKNGNNKRLLPKMKQRKWEVHKEQAGCEQWKRKRRKQQAASKGEVLPKWEREVVVYCVQRQYGHTIQVANGKHSYIFYTSIQAITAWLYRSAGYLANPWLAATCIPWWISIWSCWCTSTFWFSGIQKSTHGKRLDSWFTFHSWLPLKFAFPLLYATTVVPSHTKQHGIELFEAVAISQLTSLSNPISQRVKRYFGLWRPPWIVSVSLTSRPGRTKQLRLSSLLPKVQYRC